MPELASHVREFIGVGFYDVVRSTCRSSRASAAAFLTALAELLVATHHNTACARATLCKIASVCPVPATRAVAVKSLATLAFGKHKGDIANVALRDVNASVREVAQAALIEVRTHEEEVESPSSSENEDDEVDGNDLFRLLDMGDSLRSWQGRHC